MDALSPGDLRFVVTRLPRDVRKLLSEHAGKLFLGGGFIRATVAGETPSDIDLFGPDAEWLKQVAAGFCATREGAKLHRTDNAVTLLTPNRMAIQFITRWTFDNAEALIDSFDFTVCQAAIGLSTSKAWFSVTGDDFYRDLAARRLVYTSPKREEEPGGSMLRVIKYVKRGYSIQVDSLGAVIGRLTDNITDSGLAQDGFGRAKIIAGLLRDVDPLLIVDGMEIGDDHVAVDDEISF